MNTKTIVSKDGTSIKYEESGNGPCLILIGDALHSKTDHLMSILVALLKQNFTVIQYLRRRKVGGKIKSGQVSDSEIADVAALISEGGGSAYVFGMASGAALALKASAAGLPILKLAIFKQPFTSGLRNKEANQFNIASLFRLLNIHDKGKSLKLLINIIGLPRSIIAILGLGLLWPAIKALAPALAYDALIISEDQTNESELRADSGATIVLTGQSNVMKAAIEGFVQQLPKICHDIFNSQNHDVDPKVLGSTLHGIFSRALVRQG